MVLFNNINGMHLQKVLFNNINGMHLPDYKKNIPDTQIHPIKNQRSVDAPHHPML
jgi:hypothetical protein